MFGPINIPYDAKMLFNVMTLKPDVSFESIELTIGELCNTVKNTYGNEKGGFIAGQVIKFSGFISEEGTVMPSDKAGGLAENQVAIVTYWSSFEQHETSHADKTFKEKFSELAEYCEDTYEIGYDILWQGMPGH